MILFILKKNETYGFKSYTRRSSGLWNSTRFVVEALNERGVKAEIVEVQDNNSIDAMLTKYKPSVCVIEALWVVPEKFPILKRLHPKVKFAIHLHSAPAFLALEGIAMNWIKRCANQGIQIMANSIESYDALGAILNDEQLVYLPNVYISTPREPKRMHDRSRIHIGCFGAVRPLKNQLIQALAAIEFSKKYGKHLYFHINSTRVETMGDPVLKNLVQLFEETPHAELVQDPWFEPEDFLTHLAENIDIGMQVSLTETFNVVCADYVTAGLPIVASKEVSWISCFNKAADNSIKDMVRIMERVVGSRQLIRRNQKLLCRYSERAQEKWECWAKKELSEKR